MTLRTVRDSGGFEAKAPLPEGGYLGTLVGITETTCPETNYGGRITAEGPGFWLTFAIADEDAEGDDDRFRFVGKRVRDKFYDKLGKTSTLVDALKALDIPVPVLGSTYDDGNWIGKGCLLAVDIYLHSSGEMRNGIKGFAPLSRNDKKAHPAEAAEALDAYEAYEAAWSARRQARDLVAAGGPTF